MKHLRYLSYVLRHKWFVFLECCKLGMPWRGFIHDWSKFLPCEWFPYADHFYGKKKGTQRDKTGYYKPTDTGDRAFDLAWLHHAHWNAHHWQWWTQVEWNQGVADVQCYLMPEWAIREMVADWRGASRAQGHTSDVREWYQANGAKMMLQPVTRERVEELIGLHRQEAIAVGG
jgi:hypothetical protein